MKYRTKSADVLNSADRMQRIMEWELFCFEQDNLLWGYNEDISWVPGDPIYKDPRNFIIRSAWASSEEAQGYVGHLVRPMMEEIFDDEDYDWLKVCSDCDVWADDFVCWMCGKTIERDSDLGIGLKSFVSYAAFDLEIVANSIRQMAVYMHSFGESFGGISVTLRRDLRLDVDYFDFRLEPISIATDTLSIATGTTHSDNPFVQEKIDVVLVEPVHAEVWKKPNDKDLQLPHNIDLSGRVVRDAPAPFREPRDFSESEIAWPNFGLITELRRN